MAKPTPDSCAASGTEQGIQRAIVLAVIDWIRPHTPLADLLFHIPNGGYRGEAKSASIAGHNLKLMGAKAGIPDLCLAIPMQGYGSLYIEVKKPTGGLKPDQRVMIPLLRSANNFVAIVDEWRDGYAIIYDYLFLAQADFGLKYPVGIFDPKNHLEPPKPRSRRKTS